MKTKKKKIIYCEWAYVIGLVMLTIGTALMERANFGMSMVVAPAYIFYLKISQYITWFSFGMAEYMVQAFLVVLLSVILREFRLSFLGSFLTAIIYGFILDIVIRGISFIPSWGIIDRITCYIGGLVICTIGIAFLLHTYLSPEAYELFVIRISTKYRWKISKVKTIYDCCSCFISIALSFTFWGFGHFEGVKIGTILCALVNGSIIGLFNRILEERFVFEKRIQRNPRKRGIFR